MKKEFKLSEKREGFRVWLVGQLGKKNAKIIFNIITKQDKEFIKRLKEGLMIDPDKMEEFDETAGCDLI